jgi:hypothetical protein
MYLPELPEVDRLPPLQLWLPPVLLQLHSCFQFHWQQVELLDTPVLELVLAPGLGRVLVLVVDMKIVVVERAVVVDFQQNIHCCFVVVVAANTHHSFNRYF